MSQVIDNQKIAKNTLYLYLRMIVSMGVSLYTSRVILQVLGVDDFGIYNIVGGVIVLFSFIRISLRNCTQRFLSYQLGIGDRNELNRVMNISIQCHLFFVVLFVILLMTLGFWFVSEKLNIPEQRKTAAIVVYFVSVATFVVNIIKIPYEAAIASHEKMSFYALTSIFEVLLKLIIVFALLFIWGDKLILYSFLMLFVSIVLLLVTSVYCYKNLGYNLPKMEKDPVLIRQFFGYSGWSLFSSGSYIAAQQGGNILVNIFYGVSANAAFGIANQVANVLYSFVSNFQIAFNPQIVKAYSSGQIKEMYSLINRTSSFGYYIFLIVAVPVLSQIDFLLTLWLGAVPEYAPTFCRFLLIYFMVDSIEAPLWMLIGATGKMKVYSLWVGIITLLNIPISLFLLYCGWSVYSVFVVRVLINIVLSIIRPFYLKKLVHSFSLKDYTKNALIRPFLSTILLSFVLVFISKVLQNIHPILLLFVIFLITVIVIWTIGLKDKDRNALIIFIKNKING